jgi:hypothetical protein
MKRKHLLPHLESGAARCFRRDPRGKKNVTGPIQDARAKVHWRFELLLMHSGDEGSGPGAVELHR